MTLFSGSKGRSPDGPNVTILPRLLPGRLLQTAQVVAVGHRAGSYDFSVIRRGPILRATMFFWITLVYVVSVPIVLWLWAGEDEEDSSRSESLFDKAMDRFPSVGWMFRPVGWVLDRLLVIVMSPIILVVAIVAAPFLVGKETKGVSNEDEDASSSVYGN